MTGRVKTLEILDVSDTTVTGKFLDRLEGMKQLKALFIAGAKVTPERIERFRKARPDCRVVWSPKYKEGGYSFDRLVDPATIT